MKKSKREERKGRKEREITKGQKRVREQTCTDTHTDGNTIR